MIVRKLRLQKAWSQEQLAEMAGVSVRTIQRLERGGKPGLETAKSLASVFEVNLSTFYSQDETTMHEYDTNTEARKIDLSLEEKKALEYAKAVKEFFEGLLAYVVLAVVFFAVFGFSEPVVIWVFLGLGLGLIFQGLVAFEIIGFSLPNLEKKLVEKRLKRKL